MSDSWPKPKRGKRPDYGDVELPAGSSSNAQNRFKQALLKTKKLYQHKTLPPNSLRLLILKPKKTPEIHVELKVVSFDDLGNTEHYAALSYHWGTNNQADQGPIFVNNSTPLSDAELGKSGGNLDIADVFALAKRDKFWVRDNLFAALVCLRHETEDRCIWVDAICINQEKQDEKQAQVARMSEIYSKADRVLIWLGRGDLRTASAMKFIDKVVDIDRTQDLINDATREAGFWKDLYYLLRRGWFSRRWVIQELALAQDAIVMCGDNSVHWLDMGDAISIFADNFDAIRSSFKRSEDFDNDFHAIGEINPLPAVVLVNVISNIFKKTGLGQNLLREPIQSLEFLVSTLARFGTSDPRDTINCFRNLAKETYGPKLSGLKPVPPESDYTSDLFQVYAGFIDWVYRDSGRIDILCRRWAHREKLEDTINTPKPVKLPSWIQTIAPADLEDSKIGLRLHGDSFVGSPDHIAYYASYNHSAKIRFAPGSLPTPMGSERGSVDFSTGSNHDSGIFNPRAPQMPSVVNGATPTPASHDVPGISPTTANFSLPVGASNPRDSAISFASQTAHSSPEMNGEARSIPSSSQDQALDLAVDAALQTNNGLDAQVLPSSESKRDTSLWVQGMVIGKVTWRADPITDGVITENVVERLRGKIPKDHDGSVSDKFWRLLVAERASNGQQPPTTYRRACQWLLDNNKTSYINTKEILTKTIPQMVRDYLNRVQGVVWNRCFIEASQEKLSSNNKVDYSTALHGFSSGKTKENDLLCILFGCSVPVILRLREDEPDRCFKFLGEAYVYGLMDGEALYSLTAEDIGQHQQEFRIL